MATRADFIIILSSALQFYHQVNTAQKNNTKMTRIKIFKTFSQELDISMCVLGAGSNSFPRQCFCFPPARQQSACTGMQICIFFTSVQFKSGFDISTRLYLQLTFGLGPQNIFQGHRITFALIHFQSSKSVQQFWRSKNTYNKKYSSHYEYTYLCI